MTSVELGGSSLGLGPGEVHVWRVELAPSSDQGVSLLSADERGRAARYRSAQDRSRFVAARSSLRQILGSYLDIRPEDLEFSYGLHGKPALMDNPLRFNMSHSANMALFAVALEMEVGIDLESASVLLEPESVVRRSMSPRERRRLHLGDPEARNEAILATWVRKEAVAKGRGDGMSLSLAKIETHPGLPASNTRVRVRTRPSDRWFVSDIPVRRGWCGALATRRSAVSIRLFDLSTVIDLTGQAPLPSRIASASLTP